MTSNFKEKTQKSLFIISFCIELIQEIFNSAQNLTTIMVDLLFDIEVLTGACVMP